jgi:hypothetical protein
MESFPTQTEKALEVAKCLLKEIIPQFEIPVSLGSNNGPAFVAEVIQLKRLKNLKATHSLLPPEFRKEIKHINRTVKLQLKTLCQETHLKWDQLPPVALVRIRSSPTKWTGLYVLKFFWGIHPL